MDRMILPASQAFDSEAESPDHGAPSSATILLVDDDKLFRMIMVARLKKLGYRVFEAEDGEQGLAMLRRLHPDLTILDWMMPKLSGPDVCELVRQDPALKSIQIILMTGQDRPEDIEEGLNRGADGFMSKTASPQEIGARVHAGLRTAALLRNLACAHDMIKAKEQIMLAELQSAALFMESLLPEPGVPAPGIQLSWYYRPSLTLGGDLFGVRRWGDDHLRLFILDASGHGVSAALRATALMTFLHSVCLLEAAGSYDPSAILTEANRRFPLTSEGEYFTLWVGDLHLPTWTLRSASAGHAGAILCSPHHPSVWLSQTDLPLGFDPDSTFTTRQDQIQCGDRLYLTSDGIYETLSPEQELWGKERLQEVLERDAARSVYEVMDHCVQASHAWQQAEHFPDDAALVCLERTA